VAQIHEIYDDDDDDDDDDGYKTYLYTHTLSSFVNRERSGGFHMYYLSLKNVSCFNLCLFQLVPKRIHTVLQRRIHNKVYIYLYCT